MKPKIIKSVITNKFNHFVKSITDPYVQELVKKNSIITGGCFSSMLTNEEVHDFDIYFKTKETVKAIAEYYVNEFKKLHPLSELVKSIEIIDGADSKPKDYLGFRGLNLTPDRIKIIVPSKGIAGQMQENETENNETLETYLNDVEKADEIKVKEVENTEQVKPNYYPMFLSSNAITLSGKIQLIIRFWGDPNTIHENYDFVHCMNYYTSWDEHLELKPESVLSILTKELQYVNSRYPIASVIRTKKFIKRGWTINAGQYLKMCFAISKLDLTKIEVLEDQLCGVDTAYFAMLIEALADKLQKEPQFQIDQQYLTTIIDKIF